MKNQGFVTRAVYCLGYSCLLLTCTPAVLAQDTSKSFIDWGDNIVLPTDKAPEMLYKIELVDPTSSHVQQMPASYRFQTGDRVDISVKCSKDCYIYVIQAYGSRGDRRLMSPKDGNAPKRLAANVMQSVAKLQFDDTPGTEVLHFLSSPNPLSESAVATYVDDLRVVKKERTLASADSSKDINSMGSSRLLESKELVPVSIEAPSMQGCATASVFLSHEVGKGDKGALARTLPTSFDPNSPVTDKWALLIGIDLYQNQGMRKLRGATKDVTSLRDFLIDQHFDPKHIRVLLDKEATKKNILAAIGEQSDKSLPGNVKQNDLVVVFFASHGSGPEEHPAKNNYITPWDYDPDNPFATGISMQDLNKMMKRIQTDRKILILDTCHSGAAQSSKDVDDFASPIPVPLIGSGEIVLSSCSANEDALELKDGSNGLFTHHLIGALKDNSSLKSAFDETCTRVRREARSRWAKRQTPLVDYSRWRGNDAVLSVKPMKPNLEADIR